MGFLLSPNTSPNNLFRIIHKAADNCAKKNNCIYIVGIFYLSGAVPTFPPFSLQSLRCSPLAVVHYSFRGYCLELCDGGVGLGS